MEKINRQQVVIIGHSTTLRLGLVRSIAALECDITVVVFGRKTFGGLKPFDCYSKYITRVLFCPPSDSDALINLLLEECKAENKKTILIPASDFSAAAIDDNRERLSDYFLFPHFLGATDTVRCWMEKNQQKVVACKVGLHVPEFKIVSIKDKKYSIPVGIKYPCFTKPLKSIIGGKSFFCKCMGETDLCNVLNSIAAQRSQDVDVLIEDFKEIEEEYAVVGFSDGQNVVIPCVIRLLSMAASHFGVAKTGEIVPVDGFEQILDQFKLYVRQIGYVGIFDIDFYLSEGKIFFGEMNFRFGGSGYAVTKMGVNLPAMMIRSFCGEDISGQKTRIETSRTYVNERMCEDDWYRGKISMSEYRQIVKSSDISFVEDVEDWKPQVAFRLMHFLSYLRKLIKNR